jgi:ubiquinone biosynthesis protein
VYKGVRGVRVPRLIKPLSTGAITALSEEAGVKVTALAGASGRERRRVAELLIEALIAVPLSARGERSIFHADPHAGNLLYDERTGELVLLDWALTESLTRDERRHVAMLALMLGLRDPVGVCGEIEALALGRRLSSAHRTFMRDQVNGFIGQLPLTRLPGSMDAMRLLDRLALEGIRFPSGLMMFRKMLFTLDGILHDIAAPGLRMDLVLARHLLARSPLSLIDWIGVEASALLYGGRLWVQWAQAALSRAEG